MTQTNQTNLTANAVAVESDIAIIGGDGLQPQMHTPMFARANTPRRADQKRFRRQHFVVFYQRTKPINLPIFYAPIAY